MVPFLLPAPNNTDAANGSGTDLNRHPTPFGMPPPLLYGRPKPFDECNGNRSGLAQ